MRSSSLAGVSLVCLITFGVFLHGLEHCEEAVDGGGIGLVLCFALGMFWL